MTGKIILPDIPELELAPEKPPKGPVVWMKDNLFSTPRSSVLTLFGLYVAYLFTSGFAGFVFNYAERRWDAVTDNMKLLMVYLYPNGTSDRILDAAGDPVNQMHRVWLSLGVVVALTVLSLVFWRVGGKLAPKRITRTLEVTGGFLLFVFLGVTILDYFFGVLFQFDIGGWAWQFSGKVHFWTILVGVVLLGGGLLLDQLLGDRGKQESISMMGLLGVLSAVVIGSLWIIELPRLSGSEPGAPKVFQPIDDTTVWPWTIMLGIAFLTYWVGVGLRRVVPDRTGTRVLTLAWLVSFPVLVMAVLRDPGWDEVVAPGFNLGDYLTVGAAVLILGGVVIWAASHPAIGEWSAAIVAVIGVAIIYSWSVSMLMFIRFSLFAVLLFVLGAKTFGGAAQVRRRYLTVWAASMIFLTYLFILIKGGNTVETQTSSPFGGFVLTVIIFVSVMLLSFPFGVLLALGRTSTMPIFRLMSVAYIEVVRGVPLITWLIMSVIFLPFALPIGADIEGFVAVILFYSGFSAAYLAENVRGGLQAIRAGQKEASVALGMTTVQTMIFITLPQALRTVIPALVGQAIATFKDTSLVTIIGLLDFLALAQGTIPGQPLYRGSLRTMLIFAAFFYWIFTFSMSKASQRLEKKLGVGER
jgi:general L-amino acid transport system permease protein